MVAFQNMTTAVEIIRFYSLMNEFRTNSEERGPKIIQIHELFFTEWPVIVY